MIEVLSQTERPTERVAVPEDERLASLEREMEQLKDGLGLLGIRPCGWCGVFYRRSDPGALFDCGELVCYHCVPRWWSQRCPQLSIGERQTVESGLRRWLCTNHHAQVVARLADLPKPERLLMKLVTGCEQCNASGKSYKGAPCSYCDGRGSVWVVVRVPDDIL
jgi:hypothetical protein